MTSAAKCLSYAFFTDEGKVTEHVRRAKCYIENAIKELEEARKALGAKDQALMNKKALQALYDAVRPTKAGENLVRLEQEISSEIIIAKLQDTKLHQEHAKLINFIWNNANVTKVSSSIYGIIKRAQADCHF